MGLVEKDMVLLLSRVWCLFLSLLRSPFSFLFFSFLFFFFFFFFLFFFFFSFSFFFCIIVVCLFSLIVVWFPSVLIVCIACSNEGNAFESAETPLDSSVRKRRWMGEWA